MLASCKTNSGLLLQVHACARSVSLGKVQQKKQEKKLFSDLRGAPEAAAQS